MCGCVVIWAGHFVCLTAICISTAALQCCMPNIHSLALALHSVVCSICTSVKILAWTRQLWELGHKNTTVRQFLGWNYATVQRIQSASKRILAPLFPSLPTLLSRLAPPLPFLSAPLLPPLTPVGWSTLPHHLTLSWVLAYNLATSWCTVAFTPLGGRAAFDLDFSFRVSCQPEVSVQVLKKGHSMQMKKEVEFQNRMHAKPSSWQLRKHWVQSQIIDSRLGCIL